MASNVIVVFTPHLSILTSHLFNPFADLFERNLRNNSVSNYDLVKSITLLGHGTNRNNFIFSRKIFVEFESTNAALITRSTSMRISNFVGKPINILGYEIFMENLKRSQPRWNYDSLKYGINILFQIRANLIKVMNKFPGYNWLGFTLSRD